jgi:hypothetical protein
LKKITYHTNVVIFETVGLQHEYNVCPSWNPFDDHLVLGVDTSEGVLVESDIAGDRMRGDLGGV